MYAYSEPEEIQVRLNIADEASLLDRYITQLKDGSLQLRLTSSVLTFNHTFVNGHPRDMHIAFVAHSHTYIFSPGSPQERVFPLSVSLVWAKYFTPFDALATIDKYYDKWARDPAGKYFDLISELSHKGVRRKIISEKILSMWIRKGHLARAQGTYMHRQIELALAGEIYDGKDIEMQQFLRFLYTYLEPYGFYVYRLEWSIYDEDNMVAGQLDALLCSPSGYHLFDWKRCREPLDPFAKSCFRRYGLPPCHDLLDNPCNHYFIQQNLYAAILARKYNIVVSSMHLLQLHPELDNYKMIAVPDYSTIAHTLLETATSAP